MSEEEKKTAAEGAEIEVETPEETNEAPAQDPVTEEAAEIKEEAAAEETPAEETPAEEPEAEAEPEETGEEAGENKKEFDLFGRKKKFEKELAKKDAEIASVNDQYKRLLAEFDNYRKRTEKEKSGMYAMGAKDVIEKILPVIDNFERGFSLVTEEDKEDAFVTGMEKIYKQFGTVLTDLGVTPIEAVGKPFDPNLHNAVMHVEDENFGENTVAEEFQKGYLYKDQVVRYSMVKVAN